MNRVTLTDLQRQHGYPSITLLVNTTPGIPLTPVELDTARRLVSQADDRLDGDVSDTLRRTLITRLTDLIDEQSSPAATQALALFVSLDHTAAVRLGRTVEERVTIDDTFTTRDLVADLNRNAVYRVVTLSERTTRLFVGDRHRIVEQRDNGWPLTRNDEDTAATWVRHVHSCLLHEHRTHPLPAVLAGVPNSVRTLAPGLTDAIGLIPGNHDRTPAVELHQASWPLVEAWLSADAARAMQQLDQARSTHRYAGGVHEVWPLARDGRIATLVVEGGFMVPARIDEHQQLHPADDPHHPEVNDDIVDDTIETVLLQGGNVIVVNDGALDEHQRIAAVLRY